MNKKFELIKRNTFEIIGEDNLKQLLKKGKSPTIYWGTAPTGRPHIGYFLPILKISDFLKAGCKVKILLADLHAALDNTPWDVLERRYEYYRELIPLMIKSLGANTKKLEIIKGSSFQLKKDYAFDILKISSFISVHDAKKSASEVVKMGNNPKLSGLIYPIMQAIDEEHLEADAQLGGTDQRKIMVLARENLPKLKYKPRIEIMHNLIPSLIGGKMSSSDEKGKLDPLDKKETIKNKIKKADCTAGDTNNGILQFLKHVIMIIKQDKNEELIIKRPEKFGGDIKYKTYKEIEKDFSNKKLHPLDLKNALTEEIIQLLSLIEKNRKKLEVLSKKAYK